MDEESRNKLAGLAAERDAQLQKYTPDEEWRNLFERAKQLFRDAAFPRNVARLLVRVFVVRNIGGANCETVLARVLAKAQSKGFEAAL